MLENENGRVSRSVRFVEKLRYILSKQKSISSSPASRGGHALTRIARCTESAFPIPVGDLAVRVKMEYEKN
jgi:hypothetical protein